MAASGSSWFASVRSIRAAAHATFTAVGLDAAISRAASRTRSANPAPLAPASRAASRAPSTIP